METSRLLNLFIRRMTESDLEPLYSLLSDPEVMRFLEPPYTREQVSAFHQMGLSENPLVYAVEANGVFVGYVIYHHYHNGVFQQRNAWMVDRSNRLIAYYNGTPGGTRNTIEYAEKKGVEVEKYIIPEKSM